MIQSVLRRSVRTGTRGFAAQMQMSAAIKAAKDMKHSKDEFVHFVNQAALDKKSPEREALYRYLNQCFTDNDTDYDGLVSYRGFNAMIAEAATAPRRFGFAPTTREMYMSKEDYDLERTKLFNSLKTEKGRITQEAWIGWGMKHVEDKVGKGLQEHDKPRWERSKEECKSFFKGVLKEKSTHNMKSSTSTQYKEFYLLLNQKFVKCDTSCSGLLKHDDFNKMRDMLNTIPMKFSMDMFSKMHFDDVKGKKAGVGLQEAIQACMKCIKAQGL